MKPLIVLNCGLGPSGQSAPVELLLLPPKAQADEGGTTHAQPKEARNGRSKRSGERADTANKVVLFALYITMHSAPPAPPLDAHSPMPLPRRLDGARGGSGQGWYTAAARLGPPLSSRCCSRSSSFKILGVGWAWLPLGACLLAFFSAWVCWVVKTTNLNDTR